MENGQKVKRNIAVILGVLACAILLYWSQTSGKIFTMTKIPYEVKDELFGTTSIEWRDGFKLGLEYASGIAVTLFASAFLLWRSSRKTHAV